MLTFDSDAFSFVVRNIVQEEIKRALDKQKEPLSDYPDLLTRKQVAEILSVSLGTVENYTKYGYLNKHKFNKSVRFKKSEVLKLFKGN
jgi:excisionase family DNA binding protein